MAFDPAKATMAKRCYGTRRNSFIWVHAGDYGLRTSTLSSRLFLLKALSPKRSHAIASIVFLLTVASSSLGATAEVLPGVGSMAVTAPNRQQAVSVTLWYPAATGGETVLVGDSPVFRGDKGQRDAPIAGSSLPVVLVSHGGIRAAPHLGDWIGSKLALQGFVAAVVEPPRIGPDDARSAIAEIWQRPADMSATLTALESDPDWSRHIDPERVGALGFFLGGTAVLSLVGARQDAEQYVRSCDIGGTGIDCAWFAASGLDLRTIDLQALARSNFDPRIKVAVAIDPESTASFSGESLSNIAAPVRIINLGRPDTVLPGLNASALASVASAVRFSSLPNATRYSGFGICKPQGPAILAAEGETEAICDDSAGEPRLMVHAQLSAIIAEAFARGLRAQR